MLRPHSDKEYIELIISLSFVNISKISQKSKWIHKTYLMEGDGEMHKGYNDKAIAGLLLFLEGCFEIVLHEIKKGKSPEQAIAEELEEIQRRLEADKVTLES